MCFFPKIKNDLGLKVPLILLTFDILKPHLQEAADIKYTFIHGNLIRLFVYWLTVMVKGLVMQQNFNTLFEKLVLLQTYLQFSIKKIIDVYFGNILINPEQFVR